MNRDDAPTAALSVEAAKAKIMATVEEQDISAKRAYWLGQIVWQDGPIKVNGVNGLQVDDVIAACIVKLDEFNHHRHSDFNDKAIFDLRQALLWLGQRTADREERGVEGTDEV